MELNKVYCMDNLELLKQLPNKCIDLIYCDILYNTGKKFNSACNGCAVKEFKNKYKDKYYGDFECIDVYRYLKKKGEI